MISTLLETIKDEEDNETYNIYYEYLPAAPTLLNAVMDNSDSNLVKEVGKTIKFSNLKPPSDSNIYGIFDKISPSKYKAGDKTYYYYLDSDGAAYHYRFPIRYLGGSEVQPVIKFFYSPDGTSTIDELYIAYNLSKLNGYWRVCLFDDWNSETPADQWNLYIMVK